MRSPMLSRAHTWSLTAIAVFTGVALLWVWKRFSNRERIALAKRQTRAQLYAMRLYADDPALIFRAQGRLLIWTGRYLAQMLRPTAVAVAPLFLLFLQLDNIYGHRPLAPGESAIVTAQFGGRADVRTLDAALEGRGVLVETPGVRISERRQVCWRVRTDRRLEPVPTGSVLLHVHGTAVVQAVECGHGPRIPLALWNASPSIEVSCPAATLDVFGFGIGWPWWFLVVSGLAMAVLRRR
jgi:hypothetical protein